MGFDIYGLKPSGYHPPAFPEKGDDEEISRYFEIRDNTPGSYFRNNVWWWRPLWIFICDECEDLMTEQEMLRGLDNGGKKYSKGLAIKIAKRIDELDKKGLIAEYEIAHDKKNAEAKLTECELCQGTGTRNDKIVQGKCNACDGEGRVKPFFTHYPFSRVNVLEFRNFLKSCGGFQIC